MTEPHPKLNKILTNKTRRQIIVLLHDKGSLTYSELFNSLKPSSKGRLNYHLKALNLLLSKSESGYVLNVTGQEAWQKLQEPCIEEKLRFYSILKWGRNAIITGLTVVFLLSYKDYFDILWLTRGAVTFLVLVGIVVALTNAQVKKMSSSSTSSKEMGLHDILRDATRRKMIRLLRESGNLSYSELIIATHVRSTGIMNYHIKVLGDLLAKDQAGRYMLTERGVLAYASLNTFPNDRRLLSVDEPRKQWVDATAVSSLFLIGIAILHLSGKTDLPTVLLSLISVVAATTALFYLYITKEKVL